MSPNPNMTSSRPKNSFARWLKGEYEQSPQVPVGMDHLEANTRQEANTGLRTTSSGNTERFTRPVRVREQSGGPLRQWMTGSLPVDVIEPVVVERYHTESRAGASTTQQYHSQSTSERRYTRPVRGAPSGGIFSQWMNGTLPVDTTSSAPTVQRPKKTTSLEVLSAQLADSTIELTKANFVRNDSLTDRNINLASEYFCEESNLSCRSAMEDKFMIKIPLQESNEHGSTTMRIAPCVCAICLDPYQCKETISWSPNKKCPHVFHKPCILKYGKSSHAQQADGNIHCPLCRRDFFQGLPRNS